VNIRTLSLSLLLLLGISQSSQAMHAPITNCLPSVPALAYAFIVTNPVPTAIIGGAGYAGYKTYQYLSTPKTQK
jgi:hypothetical protein